jgi:hypothetical protein
MTDNEIYDREPQSAIVGTKDLMIGVAQAIERMSDREVILLRADLEREIIISTEVGAGTPRWVTALADWAKDAASERGLVVED